MRSKTSKREVQVDQVITLPRNDSLTDLSAQDMLCLHWSDVEIGFMGAIREHIQISNAQEHVSQPGVYIIHFDMADGSGGLSTYATIQKEEIETARSVSDLLQSRTAYAGGDFVQLILDSGRRSLAWDRASRWQRLKWAWCGIVK